ncbi:MAG TPA: putative metal-dependent hydrolase [Gemmatimonadaceae bacterium]|nr:putative metal-dependent hydrolase [Gemmatimonadaceae bacterium]
MPTATPDLRYPIGRFALDGPITASTRQEWLDDIARAPAALRAAVQGLSAEQLDTPYRPGGWTVRQLVHHVPDSHLNAYVRCKLALTESEPTIKPYDEARWAELPDSRIVPIDISLAMLDALHVRWVALLRALTPAELERTVRYPEHGRTVTIDEMVGLYAWHGRHHVAHVTALREREGWKG